MFAVAVVAAFAVAAFAVAVAVAVASPPLPRLTPTFGFCNSLIRLRAAGFESKRVDDFECKTSGEAVFELFWSDEALAVVTGGAS